MNPNLLKITSIPISIEVNVRTKSRSKSISTAHPADTR